MGYTTAVVRTRKMIRLPVKPRYSLRAGWPELLGLPLFFLRKQSDSNFKWFVNTTGVEVVSGSPEGAAPAIL